MSGAHLMLSHRRQGSKGSGHVKDFSVATPEEFVRRFGGDFVVNKVSRHNLYFRFLFAISNQPIGTSDSEYAVFKPPDKFCEILTPKHSLYKSLSRPQIFSVLT